MSGSILGIETSCDETAAAVLTGEGVVLSNVLHSQDDVHGRYGGVVPELASRRHIEQVERVVNVAMDRADVAWDGLEAIAVTRGPGLAGSLVVGVSFGKALAYAAQKPWIAVHHLEGHVASAWLEHPYFCFPCMVLVVSGGHTHMFLVPRRGSYRLIGRTVDDAAGEAFDKGAKMLGLGYPGGPALDRLARSGNPQAIHFPRPYLNRGGWNFSFSGLKTALLYYLRDVDRQHQPRASADIAASYQEAIVDVLVKKAFRAVHQYNVEGLAVVGGVSANSRLRELLKLRAESHGIHLAMPSLGFCTDNAAMIAAAGWEAFREGRYASWAVDAAADLSPSLSQSGPTELPL